MKVLTIAAMYDLKRLSDLCHSFTINHSTIFNLYLYNSISETSKDETTGSIDRFHTNLRRLKSQ